MNRKPLFLIPVKNKTTEELLYEMVYQLELHGFKVTGKPKDCKTKLTKKDVQKGFDMFIDNKEVRSRGEDTKRLYKSMYI